uniref:EIF2A domain-containing protein n=1 Tax=Steinernema glaseri TaxID=37863 RepID=A0A1I7Z3L0_9BILA
MDLSHLTKKAYGAVLSIAVSTTSIWKLTSEGTIWCSDLKEFKWKKVDRPLQASNEKIDQIRISPSGRYVWIFASASGRSWSRRDVNDVYQSGKRWTEASNDPKICDLAVGENVVWALAQGSNTLYRLRGLAAANPAGNYWKALPARLRTISVDAAENRLWAIDWNNRIIRHETEIYPPDVVEKMDKRSAAATERDFEVI